MPSNMPQGDLDVRDDPFATSRERARPPRQTIMGDEFAEVPQSIMPKATDQVPLGTTLESALAWQKSVEDTPPFGLPTSTERALTIAECAALVDAEAAILARGGIVNDGAVRALEQAADKIRGLK